MTEPENDAPEGTEPTPDPEAALDEAEADLETEPETALDEDIDEATEGVPAAATAAGARRRGAPAAGAAAAIPERAIRVDDRISKVFVLLTVGIFAVILLNGVFFGVGGVFTPFVSPTPQLTASPSVSVSASPSASGSVAPSASGSVAPSASGSVAPSASGSVAPSASGSVAPSASPSPS
jgi:hypothetical protein